MIRSKWCVCGGSQGYGRREPNAPPAPVPFRPQAADSVGLRPARTDHVAWGLRPARAEGSRGPMDRCTLRRSGAGEEGARAPRPMRREGPHHHAPPRSGPTDWEYPRHHAPPRSGPTDWEADRATARKVLRRAVARPRSTEQRRTGGTFGRAQSPRRARSGAPIYGAAAQHDPLARARGVTHLSPISDG